MDSNLLILCAGEYGTVVKEIAESMSCFERISFLDDRFGTDNPDYHEDVIGKIESLDKHCLNYTYAIPAVGNAEKRLELIAMLEENGFRIPVIVSPRAYVSPSAQLEKGVVVEPLAGIHAKAVVLSSSYISMGAVIGHNAVVMEGCHIDNNAVVMSRAKVEAKKYIASCEVVRR